MYSVYIYDYLASTNPDVYVSDPLLIYDSRSPAKDMVVNEPVVDLEDSKAGSFSFLLPVTHFAYNMLVKKKTMVTVWRDKDIPDKRKVIFEGIVTGANRDLYKNKKIYCEGFPTFLNDTCQPRKEYLKISLVSYVENLLTAHNERYSTSARKFWVEWDMNNLPEFPENYVVSESDKTSIYESTQYESTFYYLQELQSRCGGHFIFSINNTEQTWFKYLIKYVKNIPDPSADAQEIRLGYNLLDYSDSYDSSSLCTAILPVVQDGNYGSTSVGNVIGIIPDESLVIGDYDQLDDLVADTTITKGQYVYILSGYPSMTSWDYSDFHDLYLAEDVYTDPDTSEQIVKWKLLSKDTLVYWSAQLGHVEGDSTRVATTTLIADNKWVTVYRSYSFFPTTGKGNVYYLDRSNFNVYIWDNGNYTQYTNQETVQRIINTRSYHAITQHIRYYVYRGSVTTYANLPVNPSLFDSYRVNNEGQFYTWGPKEDNSLDWVKIGTINEVADTATPDNDRIYISSRALNQSLRTGYKTNYLWVIEYNSGGVLVNIDREEINPTTETLDWGSVSDKEFLISEAAGASQYITANYISVAGWGGSLLTTIKGGAYSYKVPDYGIGDSLEVSMPYWTYLDGQENAQITWDNGTTGKLSNYVVYSRNEYYDGDTYIYSGPCLMPYQYARVWHYNVSGKKAVYITSRFSSLYPTPDHGNACWWYVADASNQILYFRPFDNTVISTTVNELIDLTDDKMAGAVHLVVNAWGNVEIDVKDYIPQIGGLTDYMTVEGADDYVYYSYKAGVDGEKMHTKGSLYVESQSLIDIYGRIEKKIEFKDIGDPNLLVRQAAEYLMLSQFDDISITLTGVDLHTMNLDIDSFDVSTSVPVALTPYGINKNMPVKSLRITLNSPQDDQLELGETTTLDDRIIQGGQ